MREHLLALELPHAPHGGSRGMPAELAHFILDRTGLCLGKGFGQYVGGEGVVENNLAADPTRFLATFMEFGLGASSDSHDGHPGNAQSPGSKHHHIYHYLGSGRAAVFAEQLTRQAIFDGLYQRRCYGTTGPAIRLDVRVNGEFGMGEKVPGRRLERTLRLQADVVAPTTLRQIEVIKRGQVVYRQPCR